MQGDAPVTRRLPCGEAGVGGVLVLALSAVLALGGMTATALAAVAVARARAASAADLAALAAASTAREGASPACAAAARTAAAVGARVQQCTLTGSVADVLVVVRPPGALGRLGEASARARAGPAGSSG